MNTKSKILLVGSAVLGVVLLTGFRGGHMGWGARNPERMKQMITWRLDDKLEDLKATDEQKRTIQGLKDSLFDEGQRVMEEQRDTRKELVKQWDSAQPDTRAVHALVDARVDAWRAFAHKVADAALEAHRVLTPAQRQQVSANAREHMNERH
ncbi:Spy/CpxP family protein refolding chaperone [Cystobacter fuscus]|uniref:Spy/CpxP family protein refolding chaperone n=1 Tax=Cystobacter fuscus TaxID=43 RepID=UPI002B318723|nr:periplasmic heavy metal sensor [Cystobacter fuscus]